MNGRTTLDVRHLPVYAFGARDPLFWGIALLVTIETMMLACLFAAYFYIQMNFDVWPPIGLGSDARVWGGITTALLVASAVPNHVVSHHAMHERFFPMRRALVVVTALSVIAIVARAVELASLPFRWDANAHASTVWTLLGMQTFHLLGGVIENIVFSALTFRGPIEKKHLTDAEVNSVYWYFVVAGGAASYALLYFEPWISGR